MFLSKKRSTDITLRLVVLLCTPLWSCHTQHESAVRTTYAAATGCKMSLVRATERAAHAKGREVEAFGCQGYRTYDCRYGAGGQSICVHRQAQVVVEQPPRSAPQPPRSNEPERRREALNRLEVIQEDARRCVSFYPGALDLEHTVHISPSGQLWIVLDAATPGGAHFCINGLMSELRVSPGPTEIAFSWRWQSAALRDEAEITRIIEQEIESFRKCYGTVRPAPVVAQVHVSRQGHIKISKTDPALLDPVDDCFKNMTKSLRLPKARNDYSNKVPIDARTDEERDADLHEHRLGMYRHHVNSMWEAVENGTKALKASKRNVFTCKALAKAPLSALAALDVQTRDPEERIDPELAGAMRKKVAGAQKFLKSCRDPLKVFNAKVKRSGGLGVAVFKVRNNSRKTIDGVRFTLEFSNNFGDRVTRYNGDDFYGIYQKNIGPGKTKVIRASLIHFSTATKVKAFIDEIHCTDGTQWREPEL